VESLRHANRCSARTLDSERHAHHIVFRSHQGSSKLSNLTALCAWHHQRGVHGHVLRCMGVAPDGLRFELGLRSDGPPLAVYRSGEVKTT
jgi:HNH endonuclease